MQNSSRWSYTRRTLLLAVFFTIAVVHTVVAIQQGQDSKNPQSVETLRLSAASLEGAISRHRQAGDAIAEADAVVKLAEINQRLNEFRRALELYNRALLLYRAQHDRRGESVALNGLGSVYGRLSDYPKSLDSYNQAVPLWRAENNLKGEAAAFSGIGAAYLRLNDYKKALDSSRYGLSLYHQLDDRAGQASMLQQIGYLHFVQDEYPEAFDSYEKALTLARAVDDRPRIAVVLQSIGRAHFRRGNYQKALDHYTDALTLERSAQNQSGEAALLGAMGQVYRALGDVQKARDYLNQSLVVFRANGERLNEATSLNILGHVHLSVADFQEALSLFTQSLGICQAIGNRAGVASNTNGVGLAHAGLGDYQTALGFHLKALELFRTLGHRRAEGDSLSHIGRAYLSLGDYNRALSHLHEALALYRAVRALREETQVLYSVARAHQASGNLVDGRAEIEAAISLVEKSRQDVASEQLRSSYLASVRDLYALNIDILIELHQKNPTAGFDAIAFETSERARARSLLDSLGEMHENIREGVSPDLIEREQTLRLLIASRAEKQTQLLNSKAAQDKVADATQELESALAEYQDLQAKIRSNNPRYAALTQPKPLTVRQIQAEMLDAETVLLEYFVGPKRSYVWAITKNSLTANELAASSEIEGLAREFYEQLRAKGKVAQIEELSSRLAEMLLGPVIGQLSKKRLALVADGALHFVPFAALSNPKQTESVPRYQPLIVEHEIVSLPSASTLALINQESANRPTPAKVVAVVADPVFDPNDVRVRQKTVKSRSAIAQGTNTALSRSVEEIGLAQVTWPLPRLLGTRREARAILSLAPSMKSRQALDFDASRETVTSGDLAKYQVVHFATHALINNRHPELSGLVLSLVDKQGKPQDGFLRLVDIFNLRLPVDLVVLSACQTGLGKEVRSEGLIGLSRGFIYAGAPRLVTSLWQIDDKATSELMAQFYSNLLGKRKLTAAAALRDAQIEMWRHKDWQSPYYWAAFTFQGEWR